MPDRRFSRRRLLGLSIAAVVAAIGSRFRTSAGESSTFVALVATPSGAGLWTLDQKGQILSFGDARDFRAIPTPGLRPQPFVALAATPSGAGLWTLDQKGQILSFGDARDFRAIPTPGMRPQPFVALAATPSGEGLWTLDQKGQIFTRENSHLFCGHWNGSPV